MKRKIYFGSWLISAILMAPPVIMFFPRVGMVMGAIAGALLIRSTIRRVNQAKKPVNFPAGTPHSSQ